MWKTVGLTTTPVFGGTTRGGPLSSGLVVKQQPLQAFLWTGARCSDLGAATSQQKVFVPLTVLGTDPIWILILADQVFRWMWTSSMMTLWPLINPKAFQLGFHGTNRTMRRRRLFLCSENSDDIDELILWKRTEAIDNEMYSSCSHFIAVSSCNIGTEQRAWQGDAENAPAHLSARALNAYFNSDWQLLASQRMMKIQSKWLIN